MPDLQPPIDKPAAQAAHDTAADAEQLAHLYKMSTTSAGGTEYVAINGVSIAAVLLGIASVLALANNVFLIISLAGAICGVMSIIQIRRSSGTQTGMAFAIIGLALSLFLAAGRLGVWAMDESQTLADTRQVVPLIAQLSQGVHGARYDEAYEDLFTNAFRARVDRLAFAAGFEKLNRELGSPEFIEWNGEHVEFYTMGNTGVKTGNGMARMKYNKLSQPIRALVTFSNRDGPWKIDNFDPPFTGEKSGKKEMTPQ